MLMPFNLVSLKSRKLVWLSSDLWRGAEISAEPSSLKSEGQKTGLLTCCWMCTGSKEYWLLLRIRLCQTMKFHEKFIPTQFFLW